MVKKFLVICVLALGIFTTNRGWCDENSSSGLLVSVIQQPFVFSSREAMTDLVDFAQRAHIKNLYIQIYRSNIAWFPSKITDASPYETFVKKLSEDPLSFLIEKAHAAGIKVYAWLNMLTLNENKKATILKKYGPEILTRNLKPKKKLEDYKIDDQYFLEPGDPRVREELINIVEEIVRTYPKLDGLLFDYIRYPDPTANFGYTPINMKRFKKATGLKTVERKSDAWKNWKRTQVTEFLEMLIKRAHAIRPELHIAATGCMPYARAYAEAFQDWPMWLDRGLVEFVVMMNYSPDPKEFKEWTVEIKPKITDFSKVKIGVGAYKLMRLPQDFKEEWETCSALGAGECVVFHYGSLQESPGLKKVLTKEKE